MLRSLVGSEMCIRDRTEYGHVARGLCSMDSHGYLSKVVERTKIQCIGGCLLYTSDAADDLLCVGLGGRRIIKKKNNITQ